MIPPFSRFGRHDKRPLDPSVVALLPMALSGERKGRKIEHRQPENLVRLNVIHFVERVRNAVQSENAVVIFRNRLVFRAFRQHDRQFPDAAAFPLRGEGGVKIAPESPDPEGHLIAGGAGIAALPVAMGDAADNVSVPPMDGGAEFHSPEELPCKFGAFPGFFRKEFRAENADFHCHSGIDHAVLHAGGVALVVRESTPDLLRQRQKIEAVLPQGSEIIVDQICTVAEQSESHLLPGGIQGL